MTGKLSSEKLGSWQALYKAALFETDAQKLGSRIEEARRALVLRSRDLFSLPPNCDGEAEAIDDAMYALTALQSCLQLNTKDRRRNARTA